MRSILVGLLLGTALAGAAEWWTSRSADLVEVQAERPVETVVVDLERRPES